MDPFRSVRCYFAKRKLGREIRDGNTISLAAHLDEFPELESEYSVRATAALKEGRTHAALALNIAFARHQDSLPDHLLDGLLALSDSQKSWHDLDDEEVALLEHHAHDHNLKDGEIDERNATFLHKLSDEQFVKRGNDARTVTQAWIREALCRSKFWFPAVDHLTFWTKEAASGHHRDWAWQTLQLQLGEVEESLRGATTYSEVGIELRRYLILIHVLNATPKPDCLVSVVESFSTLHVEHLAYAAQILCRCPDARWQRPLANEWHRRLKKFVYQDGGDKHTKEVDRDIEVAIFHVLAALGACASCDKEYLDFKCDEALVDRLSDLIDILDEHVCAYNDLVEEIKAQYPQIFNPHALTADHYLTLIESLRHSDAGFAARHDRLKELERAITELRAKVGKEEAGVQQRFTAGYLLQRILNDEQHYPTEVRQGAALGVFFLLRDGGLDLATHRKLRRSLNGAVHGEDKMRYRELRLQLLPGSFRSEIWLTWHAGLAWMNWIAMQPPLNEVVVDGDMSEHLAPQPDITALRDGAIVHSIAADEVAAQSDPSANVECLAAFEKPFPPLYAPINFAEETNLFSIVWMICDRLPLAIKFFSNYPLRLMRGNDKHLLGFLEVKRCRIEYWTRYVPPLKEGNVRMRYLELDDRLAANAMGLHFQLFRHPVLVIPVLFHEYLHYAGTDNDPTKGIANEMEVRLREILFARGLLLDLAPSQRELIAIIESLRATAEALDMGSVVDEIFWPVENDGDFLQLQLHILSMYGFARAHEEACQEANDLIIQENQQIRHLNFSQLEYDKHIPYPELGTPETFSLTEKYRQLLIRRLMTSHEVTFEQRDSILAEHVKSPRACE